jgi:hypothetical protein
MAKKNQVEKFIQRGPLVKVEPTESFRDLPLKKQRERMRVMYRDVKLEEEAK